MLSDNNSLSKCANNIRDYYNNLYNYLHEYSEMVKKEIVKPIEVLINIHNDTGIKLDKDYKKIDKEYKDSITNLEKAKTKYHSTYSQLESAAKDFETAKVCLLQTGIDKFQNKQYNILKEAKDSEKAYLKQLSLTNNIRINYIDELKRILNSFEKLDVEYNCTCKEVFQKYSIFTNALVANQNYDIDKLKKSVNSISIHNDIQDFIYSNKTNNKYPSIHEFYQYKINLQSKPAYEYPYPTEVILNTIQTLHNNFEVKNTNWNYYEELNKVKINEIATNAIKGEDISQEDKNMLVELLEDKKYRIQFLSSLNNFRIKGYFNISTVAYEIIGLILKKIIELVTKNNDYESAKYVIILSQTFKNNDKCLQSSIQEEPILKGKEFWENMIARK